MYMHKASWDVITDVAPNIKRYKGSHIHRQLAVYRKDGRSLRRGPFEPDADGLVPTHALVVSCSP